MPGSILIMKCDVVRGDVSICIVLGVTMKKKEGPVFITCNQSESRTLV